MYGEVIDIKSAISHGLPSSFGKNTGIKARQFMENLIDINNEFLEKCFVIMKGEW